VVRGAGSLINAVLAAAAVTWCAPGAIGLAARPAPQPASLLGAHDPAWAPGGSLLALTLRDQVWVLGVDGRDARTVARWPSGREAIERDPAFSPDGRTLAFAARLDDQGFDLYLVDARGGAPRQVTSQPGDERWPSWTPDGRLVFAARSNDQWDLMATSVPVDPAQMPVPAAPRVERLTASPADETEPRVSPDGRLVAFVSNREAPDGESDLWLLELAGRVAAGDTGPVRPEPVPLLRARGAEWSPAWSPDGGRVAYATTSGDTGAIRIVDVEIIADVAIDASRSAEAGAAPVVVSRHAGQVAWSPDGRTLLVTDLADRDDGYNGQPSRGADASAPSFPSVMDRGARLIPAPSPADAAVRPLRASAVATPARRLAVFDGVWDALARRYYAQEPAASAWRAARDRHRPRAAAAADDAALEDAVDALVADQPLVHPPIDSAGGLVVSAHPLASEAGAAMLRAGGNAIDAAIAASFALGVVEPDASGIGGDGMALVWRAGAEAPIVVDFKDQAPAAASLDNPAIFRDGRLPEHGPAALNIPGVVAGMEHLHRRFGSGRVPWADLVAPAIRYAEEGVVLDGALPATIAEAQATVARYEATLEVFMPGGRLPRPGDRFINRDYAATLRTIAAAGADAFYRGTLARRMVDDIASHGGILTLDDLEQYRPLERQAVRGRYRGQVIFSTPPPVSSGTAVVELLQTLDRQPWAPGTQIGHDVDAAHLLIEAFKQAHQIRAADPALWPDETAVHLTAAHAAEVFSHIEPGRASRGRAAADDTEDEGGAGAGASGSGSGEAVNGGDAGAAEPRLGRGTSALVVADRAGNVIVVTQTLSTWGGSFYVSRGLGFLYNNHLRMARTRRGAAGQLTPRARSSSANASTIVCREVDGRLLPRLAVAAAGSAWIVPSVVEVVTGVVDGNLSAQAAVEAPRLRVDDGGRVQMEDRFPRVLVQELVRRGHVLSRIGAKGELRYGFVSAIAVDPATGRLSAGADPRRSHTAVPVP
jgi:gamma-glutamyltranspeptidase